MLKAIQEYTHNLNTGEPQNKLPMTSHYVIDGGSLLHSLKCVEGYTYICIAESYTSFTVRNYGQATVVFDGYTGKPTTKDDTHERRRTKVANNVEITSTTKFSGKKEYFLSNAHNKQVLINLISHVIHAEADADVDIVKSAVSMSSKQSTTFIGEDTDLLVLLLNYAKK